MKLFRNIFILATLGVLGISFNGFALNTNSQKSPLIQMVEKLNLTAEQKKQLSTIETTQTAEYKATSEQLKQINKQMHALQKDKVLDEKKLDQLINQKKELLGKIMKRSTITRHQITHMLTHEQLKQLHQEMKKKREKRV